MKTLSVLIAMIVAGFAMGQVSIDPSKMQPGGGCLGPDGFGHPCSDPVSFSLEDWRATIKTAYSCGLIDGAAKARPDAKAQILALRTQACEAVDELLKEATNGR